MLTWIINWLNKVDIDFQVTTIVLRTSWFTGVESSSSYYEPGAETALTLNNRGFLYETIEVNSAVRLLFRHIKMSE